MMGKILCAIADGCAAARKAAIEICSGPEFLQPSNMTSPTSVGCSARTGNKLMSPPGIEPIARRGAPPMMGGPTARSCGNCAAAPVITRRF